MITSDVNLIMQSPGGALVQLYQGYLLAGIFVIKMFFRFFLVRKLNCNTCIFIILLIFLLRSIRASTDSIYQYQIFISKQTYISR